MTDAYVKDGVLIRAGQKWEGTRSGRPTTIVVSHISEGCFDYSGRRIYAHIETTGAPIAVSMKTLLSDWKLLNDGILASIEERELVARKRFLRPGGTGRGPHRAASELRRPR